MPHAHGKDALFKVTSGGTMQNISQFLTSEGLQRTVDMAESSTQGDSIKEYVAGLTDATIPLEGRFDATVDGYLATILAGAATAFEYYPQGSATGLVKYSGSVILTSYEINTDIGDVGSISGEFQVVGAITRAVL